MELVGQVVQHVTFGTGVISKQSDRFVLVDFEQGQKRFAYPKAFSQFLKLKDADMQKQASDNCQKAMQVHQERKQQELAKRERLEQLHTISLSPQSQAVFDIDMDKAAAYIRGGSISTGTYLSGYSKGNPKVPNRMKPNTCCLLTGVPQNGTEKDRRILGVFMVDENFYGTVCKDGIVLAHEKYRVLLPEDKQISYWDQVEHEEKVLRWGRAVFKYMNNAVMQKILKKLTRQLDGTEEKESMDALYHYYCYVNRLQEA